MTNLNFRKVDGTPVEDVEKYVKDWVQRNPFGKVIIGCDSQMHGRKIKYSIAIVMHMLDSQGIGHGAHVLVADVWEKRITRNALEEMPTKLWKEAEYVQMAAAMVDGSDESFKKKITLHLDYSSNEKYKSNSMFNAGIGYLSGLGYKAEGKPHAYVSTHTADHFCR